MPGLGFKKVTAVPSTLDPDTLYLLSNPENAEELVVIVSDNAGVGLRKTIDRTELADMLDLRVKKSDQVDKTPEMQTRVGIDATGQLWTASNEVTTRVQTNYMPNVGDFAEVALGEHIILRLTKTSNSGNEVYRSELMARTTDRLISYRRDSIYDNSSTEGSNANELVLKASPATVVDATVYGSMRDFAQVIVVDLETFESWVVRKFHFGKGNFRAIVESCIPPVQ